MNFKSIITFFFIFSFSTISFTQENLEETKKIADKFFEEEKYVEATPYYLRLLAVQPRDHNFNYHYGACLLFNGTKSQDVFKYLNYAITNENVEAEANYFLGRAYHLNFQFNDAIKYFKIYQLKAGTKPNLAFDVQRQIEMCENGKKLITTITEMIVLDKKEIEKDKFFRIYDLSDIGGNLLVTAEFQTKLDEKKAHIPLIHFPANPTVIYYSSYGESGKTGKDIYVQRRLPTGGWGLPQALKGDVNTKYDEDYPYMHPDGQYLYFSSKGHNSMGGFDVFRCKYDAETDMFGKAENMDFAISSPNDDLFYVVDSLNKNAYFGSNRQSEEGKLFVYKVRVDRVPLNMSVIKGEFNSTINPQMKKVFIDVKDYSNGEFIGNFNSNEKGVYIITFPKGGKYEFTIKVGENKQEFKYLASIPFQKEFKPLKQKIIHEQQGAAENVRVLDLFNEEVEDPQGVFAQVIKMKSELKPNVSVEELARMEKESKDKEIIKVLGLGNLSLIEVGYLLEDEVKDAKRAEGGNKELESKIYAQVLENTNEIKRLDKSIKDKIDKANASTTDKKKYKYLKEAELALKSQEEIKLLNVKSLKFADSLASAPKKGSSAATEKAIEISTHFNELMKEHKQAEAFSYLSDNKDMIKKMIDEKSPDPLQDMIEKGLVLDEEIARLQPKDDDYARDLKKIDSEIEELERSKNGAKKKQIEETDALIKSKKSERAMINEERTFNGTGLKEKIAERSSIRKQVDELEGIYAVKSSKEVTKEELELALSTANATNSAEMRSQISQQISQLVLTSPDVKAVDYEDLEKDLGSVVTNSRGRSDKIKADATLTPEEKANKLKALDREMLSSIKNEILTAEKALKANPTDPALIQKIESLKNAKTLVSSALDLPEGDENSEEVASSDDVSSITENQKTANAPASNPEIKLLDAKGKEDLIESFNSSYDDKKSQISNNNSISEVDKLNQLQDLDRTLLSNLDTEISKVSEALRSNSTDPMLLSKLKNLESIHTDLLAKMSTREEVIMKKGTSSTPVSATLDEKGKSDLVESISSSYDDKLAEINNNSSLPEVDKLTQLQQLDKSLLSSLDTEISKLNTALKANPSDSELLSKLKNLESIQSDLEAKISSREEVIVKKGKSSNLDSKTKENLIESINSSYNDKLSQISENNSLSESEKLIQFQNLDKELLASINEVIGSIETSIKENPANVSLVNKLENLKTIKSEIEGKISSRESSIDTNVTNTNSELDPKKKENLVESINSEYNEKYAQLNSNKSLSEIEKLTQLNQLDEALLSNVAAEISKTEVDIRKNPADASLKMKLNDLKTVRSDLEITVAAREKTITSKTGVVSSNLTSPLDSKAKENLIEYINSSYNEKVSQINSNAALSESEKLNQLQNLDKELLTSLNKELSTVASALSQNPKDADLLKKEAGLKLVKSEVETTVSSRESVIVNSSQPLSLKAKTDLIDGLSPMYNVKINEIKKNSSLSETDKITQLQKADKDLIGLINKEISALENNIKNNPDPQLIKDLSDLKSVKSELESAVSARENQVSSSPSSTVEVANLSSKDKENLIESVNSSYNEKNAQITGDNKLSESEKLVQLQSLDKELLASINKELTVLSSTLKTNPKDAVSLKKQVELNSIKSELDSKINIRESSIASSTLNSNQLDAKSKEALIESVSASYNEKNAQITGDNKLSESEKLVQLQSLDKELLASINKELTLLSSTLKTNPKDAVALKKQVELNSIKSELDSKINIRESSIASSTLNSNQLDAKSKEALIESVSASYNEKTSQINSNNSLSNTEKLNQIQLLDKELLTSVSKELLSIETSLKKNPSDPILVKKSTNFSSIKSELEIKIKTRETSLASTKPTLDAGVKSEVIKNINAKYDKSVASINSNNELSVTEKLDKLQELDYSLIEGLKNEIAKVESDLSKKPTDVSLTKKIEDLKAVKSEIENSVSERESVIASSGSDIDSKAKSEAIETVSSSYNEKVEEVKGNDYLLDTEKQAQLQDLDKELLTKVVSEISSLEKSLASNPTNTLQKRKLDELKVVKSDLDLAIGKREKLLSPSDENHALAAKSELIEKFNPEYNEKVAEINSHAINSQVEKLEELQKLDQELLISIDAEVKKASAAAKSRKKDVELQKAKQDIIDLKTLTESVISEREKEITHIKANSVSEQQKNDLIAEVNPKYKSNIQKINDSKSDHGAQLQELIKEEQNLISELENKENSVQSDLKKTPEDAKLKMQLTVVSAAKVSSQDKIEDLTKQAVTLKANNIDQKTLVLKIDPSFDTDINKIVNSNSVSKSNDLVSRENLLQEKIQSQISSNEKDISSKYNIDLAAENQILAQKLKESNEREVNYSNGSLPSNTSSPENQVKVTELRSEILGKSSEEIGKTYSNVEDLKAQENVVIAYSDVINSRLDKVNKELITNANDQTLLDQKQLLESELKISQSKSKSIASQIEKLEGPVNALTSPELEKLVDQEAILKEKLTNTQLTKKEKSTLEKELEKVQTEKSIVSNKLITENLAVRKVDNNAKSGQLKQLAANSEISKVSSDLANSQNSRLTSEADALIIKSDKTKNPTAKNELLTQAIEKQTLADEIVQTALEENTTRAAIVNQVKTLDSKEELEEKKRKYSVEIGEITSEIEQLDTQISGMKAKKAESLVAKKAALTSEKSLTEKELEDIDRQLNEITEFPKTINEGALAQPVSFEEEKKIISSKEYLEYSINANKALRIEKEIAENELVLTEKRQTAKEVISMSLDKSSNVKDAEVKESIKNVKVVEDEIKKLTVELAEKQAIATSILSKNDVLALQMQNLLKRGVEPEFNESLALIEQQRKPAIGLTVVSPETPINNYSASNPIPVDVKNPAGLVYRIQVGAFSKPILQDMYKSFNPVSGEKLASGVTRYMAGYFNNNKTVELAHEQVKTLGYKDAFIVAYCDDKRIPLAEAIKLEETGQCISTESREFVIAMSTAKPKNVNIKDLSYNEAPGAAKAIAVETKMGLFFTVQVGVYNKPATPKQLKFIDPLVTKRLENGQIRYSTGMFNSVESAKPKKVEAVGKGVRDAFVTAYFKGERLTLSQAARVLREQGNGVLEKIDENALASLSNKEVSKVTSKVETVKAELVKESNSVAAVSSYNKAPGAVSAKAVEAHLGLFFTVQIGVYSKPATKKQLNYISPLITKKLPNGQLRYSTGMYNSIESADPKRKEALEKGVKHAYITAYYKGERITISEAKELLSANGDAILEKLDK